MNLWYAQLDLQVSATFNSYSVTVSSALLLIVVPALVCIDPEFSMGGITARWSFIHTGGQDLTSVLVSYTFEEGAVESRPISLMITNPTITAINVPRLIAGTRYTFNITAVNDIGYSYVLCGPILLNIGRLRGNDQHALQVHA